MSHTLQLLQPSMANPITSEVAAKFADGEKHCVLYNTIPHTQRDNETEVSIIP